MESRLQAEVAEGGQCCEGGCVGVRVGSKRRFLPHLEEIPEESRCSTILKERGEKEEEEEESEISEDSGAMGSLEGGSEGGTGKSRQQASMDSGIVTRFGSSYFLYHPTHHGYLHQVSLPHPGAAEQHKRALLKQPGYLQ